MANTYTNLLYHIVFATKRRRKLITKTIEERLQRYIGGIVRGEGGVLIDIGGVENHLHLVVRIPARIAVAVMVRKIKANSSGLLNRGRRLPPKFAWQTGYGAFTVSPSQLEAVCAYVRNQAEHHRKIGFKEEFLALLKKHDLNVDTGGHRRRLSVCDGRAALDTLRLRAPISTSIEPLAGPGYSGTS